MSGDSVRKIAFVAGETSSQQVLYYFHGFSSIFENLHPSKSKFAQNQGQNDKRLLFPRAAFCPTFVRSYLTSKQQGT